MILDKLTSLNRQSLESLLAILEEKTAVYTQSSDTYKIGELICALKLEVTRLVDKLASENSANRRAQKEHA